MTNSKAWRLPKNGAAVAAPSLTQLRMLKVLLRGSISLFGLMSVLLIMSYTLGGHTYVIGRLLACAAIVCFLGILILLSHRSYVRLAATLLVAFYAAVAFSGMWMWGTNLPFALLLLTLVIVMAGILLGSRAVLFAAIAVIVGMVSIQSLISSGHNPNSFKPEFYRIALGDALGYALFFGILAVVAWLFGTQIENSFAQVQAAEVALEAEKDSLEIKLAERTKKLQAAQLKEMQQLYKFAELGQLSTSLLHDLANHLTVLTLDIEDLHKKERSEAITHAKQSITHLDKLVEKVRAQMQGDSHLQKFNTASKARETIGQLQQKAVQSKVVVRLKVGAISSRCTVYGDPTRYSQIMAILISNAIDSYQGSGVDNRRVVVEVDQMDGMLQMSVHDWGKGITSAQAKKLFRPFFTSKDSGMGIGLFIAQQMAENHFKGKLYYDESSDHTVFRLQIPRRA